MKKRGKPLLIIGVILIVLNCISLISDPTIIPDVLSYSGNIVSLVGVFTMSLLGLILILIYLAINRTNK